MYIQMQNIKKSQDTPKSEQGETIYMTWHQNLFEDIVIIMV